MKKKLLWIVQHRASHELPATKTKKKILQETKMKENDTAKDNGGDMKPQKAN